MRTPRSPQLVVSLLILVVSSILGASRSASAQAVIFVNSTLDQPVGDEDYCRNDVPCTLRRALNSAGQELSGAIVRACFDPAEIPGARPCPADVTPLRTSDPNFDPATGKWTLHLTYPQSIIMTNKLLFMDFRQGLTWKTPADNRIVIDGDDVGLEAAFSLESDTNILAGFDIRGTFSMAAVVIRGGIVGDASRNNQIGPGVVFADIKGPEEFVGGHGIQIITYDTRGNKIVGNWCGIKGDGTVLAPVGGDCVYLEQGTVDNVIGDASPGNANLFAAAAGSGIRMEDSEFVGLEKQTRDNAVEYNRFGLNAKGEPTGGLASGILISYAPFNRIKRNVIVSARGAGITVQNAVTGTLITDNTIGAGLDGKTCMPNMGDGIQLLSGPNETRVERNYIFCNRGNGITVQGGRTRLNVLSQNSISGIQGKPISLSSSGNESLKAPRLDEVTETTLKGVGCAGCTVEVFSDVDKQADVFEGSIVAGADGSFTFSKPGGFLYRYVTATVTQGKNSSALATALLIPGNHVARTPTPTPTPTPWGGTSQPVESPSPSPTGRTVSPTPTGTVGATPTATGGSSQPTVPSPTGTGTGPQAIIHLPLVSRP